MFERLESPYSSNCCLSSLFEDAPISNFRKTALKGHVYITFSSNSWNMPTIAGFLFLMISSVTSFSVAGCDQLMKFLELAQNSFHQASLAHLWYHCHSKGSAPGAACCRLTPQGAKHHTATFSLPSSEIWERTGKRIKLTGWDNNSLIGEKGKGK